MNRVPAEFTFGSRTRRTIKICHFPPSNPPSSPPLLLLVLLSPRSFVFFIEFFWSTRFYIKYIHLSLFIVRPRVCIYGMEPIKTLRTIANRDFTIKLFAFIKPKKLKCIFSDSPPPKKKDWFGRLCLNCKWWYSHLIE